LDDLHSQPIVDMLLEIPASLILYAVIINCLTHWGRGAFKLFKCTFPGSKQFKSTFILCFF